LNRAGAKSTESRCPGFAERREASRARPILWPVAQPPPADVLVAAALSDSERQVVERLVGSLQRGVGRGSAGDLALRSSRDRVLLHSRRRPGQAGALAEGIHALATSAQPTRKRGDYEAITPDPAEARNVVEGASNFVDALERMLEG
jgi:hypothetical protein